MSVVCCWRLENTGSSAVNRPGKPEVQHCIRCTLGGTRMHHGPKWGRRVCGWEGSKGHDITNVGEPESEVPLAKGMQGSCC